MHFGGRWAIMPDVHEAKHIDVDKAMWAKRTVQIKPTKRQMSPLWVS